MNSSHSRHDSAVEDQAAFWAARLDGDVLDAEQRAELDAWLAKSPTHRALLSEYCQFSADLEGKVQALVNTGMITLPASEEDGPRRKGWSFPRVASVVLAAAAAIAIGVWANLPKPQIENVATSVAQRHTHVLADGTRVELNADTSLRFENTKTERRVRLSRGEALFAVAKNPTHPFIVETPSGSIQVTGTTFNVRNDTSTITLEVTVVEGSVEVRPSASGDASKPYSLKAGDQLAAGAAGVSVRQLAASTLEDTLAWRDGQIVFVDVPLHEVASRLARHHGRRITVSNEVAGQGVGGRYGMDDFNSFLSALEVALPVTANRDLSGAVTIVPRRR